MPLSLPSGLVSVGLPLTQVLNVPIPNSIPCVPFQPHEQDDFITESPRVHPPIVPLAACNLLVITVLDEM